MSKDLEQLKEQISILEYGEKVFGLTPCKRGKYWGFKEHDSVRVDVSKNVFYRNSRYVVGEKSKNCDHSAGGIVDFIMHFNNCDTNTAIRDLKNFSGGSDVSFDVSYRKKLEKENSNHEFVVPEKYVNNKKAFFYLCKTRAIEPVVFNFCVKHKYIYQEHYYNKYKQKYRDNIVFASYQNDKMVFAQRCKTELDVNPKYRKLDVEGSKYDECWYIDNGASKLIVTEAPIDTLSFMSLLHKNGKRFTDYNHQGLTGTNKVMATINILNNNPHITELYMAVDQDEAGDKCFEYVAKWVADNNWQGGLYRLSPTKGVTFNKNGEDVQVKDINDILKFGVDDAQFFAKLKKI